MTLEQIKNFIALADFRNFTKAAERNFISQSSLSRSVAGLENSLGIKLLERDTRYVTLTKAGEYLRDEGNRILDELYMLELRLRDMSEGKVGHLLALTSEFFFEPFSEGCREFSEKYPDVDLELETEKSWQVPERVIMREVDVGLTFSHETDSDDLGVRVILSDRLCALVPRGHRLAEKDSISLDALDEKEVLYFGDSSFKGSGNSAVLSGLQGRDRTPKYHIIRSMSTALQKMHAGQGVVVLPSSIGEPHAANGNCVMLEITDELPDFEIALVYRRDNANPSLKKFLELFPEQPDHTKA